MLQLSGSNALKELVMDQTGTIPVVVTRQFSRSAEEVYDAWLDAETAARFWFATPDGEMVISEIDPHVGGHFTLSDRRDGDDYLHTGSFLELERPHRIVFNFCVPAFSDSLERVEIDIHGGDRGCEVTLTNHMSEQFAEYREQSQKGWSAMLETLARVIGDEVGGDEAAG